MVYMWHGSLYEILKVEGFFSKRWHGSVWKSYEGVCGQRVGVNSVSLRKSTVLLPVRFLRAAVSKGRGTPYLCEGFLCKLASIFYVFDVEGCDFDPLPVEFLGLYLQNQLELGKKPLSKDPLSSVCSLTGFDLPRIVRSMWALSILSRETLRTSKTTSTTRGPSDTREKDPQDGMFGCRLIVLIFLSNTINVWMVYLPTFCIKINYMYVKHTVLYIDPMCFEIPSIKWPKPLPFHAFSLCIIGPRP